MTDPMVMYGNRKPFNSESTFLFGDLVADYVDQTDHQKLVQPWALEKLMKVVQWLKDNQITEDDCMLCYVSFWRAQTHDTSVRYYLHLARPEHRTLFLLCKDGMMDRDTDA